MDNRDYEQDLGIDPMQLDEEWLRQPGLYMRYSEMAAEAQKVRDQAKEKVDVIKAELDRAIRKDPAKFGVDKITESVVASTILIQPEYKAAGDVLIDANYEYSVLQSAVRAFDHRKSALENEVKLWLGSYYSGPKEPRDIPGGKRIVDIARDKVSSRAREVMNKDRVQPESTSDVRRRRS